jgi:hypothetical protein
MLRLPIAECEPLQKKQGSTGENQGRMGLSGEFTFCFHSESKTTKFCTMPGIHAKISHKCNELAGLIVSIRSEFVKKDVYPVLYLVIVDDLHPDAFR